MHKNVTIIEGNQIGHIVDLAGISKLSILLQFLEHNQVATALLVNYW